MTDLPAEALQLARAALAAHERVNGTNHPWIRDSAGVTADGLAPLGGAERPRSCARNIASKIGPVTASQWRRGRVEP